MELTTTGASAPTNKRSNSMSKKYNGWTNYETWRVNLDHLGNDEMGDYKSRVINGKFEGKPYEAGQEVKKWVESRMVANGVYPDHGGLCWAEQYALAFLSEVNWYEIGESILAIEYA
jgi:hypothetical protein